MSHRLGRAMAAGMGLAAGTALALGAGPAAHAATTSTTSHALSAHAGNKPGARKFTRFQKAHGLKQTGRADPETMRAMRNAPWSQVKGLYAPDTLTQEEINNGCTVIGVGKGHGISAHGQEIALMTAMTESHLHNYTTAVDHDSLGIFQQRPSTGWGTPAQITNVVLSTQSFYGVAAYGHNPGLIQIPNWQTRDPGAVAQAIQHSAYPGRYDQNWNFAVNFYNGHSGVPPITGNSGGGCGGTPPASGCTSAGPNETDYDGDTYPTRYCDNYQAGYTMTTSGQRSGYLKAGTNWFVCQKQFPNWENPAVGGARNNYWLYTQGDEVADTAQYQAWGWFPATKVRGGSNYGRIPGLPLCSTLW